MRAWQRIHVVGDSSGNNYGVCGVVSCISRCAGVCLFWRQLAPFLLSAVPAPESGLVLPGAVPVFSSVAPSIGVTMYNGTVTGLVNGQAYAGASSAWLCCVAWHGA